VKVVIWKKGHEQFCAPQAIRFGNFGYYTVMKIHSSMNNRLTNSIQMRYTIQGQNVSLVLTNKLTIWS
jgi:phosphatidate phosphatase PAH1